MQFFRFLLSKVFLRQLLYALLAVVVIVFIALYWLKVTTNHDEYITVPNLAKLDLEIVEIKLSELNLRYEIIDSSSYNPEFPPYSVIEQIPAEGKAVKANRKIYLSLNPSGYPKLEIPKNTIGKSLRQVRPSLLSLGFEIGEIKEVPYLSDVVLHLIHNNDTIQEGDLLIKTAKIDLVIGDGKLRYGQLPSRDTIPGIDSLRTTVDTLMNVPIENVEN